MASSTGRARHLGPYIDVRTQGALMDGVTDDTAAIQRAYDVAGLFGDSWVYIPAGDCLISGTVDVPSGSRLEAAGGQSTRILSAAPTTPRFKVDGKTDVSISGLGFAISSGVSTSDGVAILVCGASSEVFIHGVETDAYIHGVKIAGNYSGGSVNHQFSLEVSGTATGGTYIVGGTSPASAGGYVYTAAVNHNASAGTLQTALETIFGAGNVSVTGTGVPGSPYAIILQGACAGLWSPPLAVYSSVTGTGTLGVMVQTVTRGGGAWSRDISIDRCRFSGSPSLWGLHIDDAEDIHVSRSAFTDNWLDGAKLRQFGDGVRFTDCDFNNNGQGWYSNPALYAGDGIDTYTGGSRVTFTGCRFNENAGSGVQIKNDDGAGANLSGYGAGKWSVTKRFIFTDCEAVGNMISSGIGLTYVAGVSDYAVTDVEIHGGRYENNGYAGIYVTARKVIVSGVSCKRNAAVGIFVDQKCSNVIITTSQIHANGRGTGTGYGIIVGGKDTIISDCDISGTDSEAAIWSTDESTLTKHHLTNIAVNSTASKVYIDNVTERNNSSGRGITIQSGATEVIVNQRQAGLVAGSSLVYGSPGSTLLRTDASDPADILAIKTSGAVDAVGIWQSLAAHRVISRTTLYTATGFEDAILCSASGGAYTITLPAASVVKGKTLTIKKTDASANAVTVDGNAAETIDGAATYALAAQYKYVTMVSDGANWHIVANN